jgi:ABC-type amino acid transport substrate-binding protein
MKKHLLAFAVYGPRRGRAFAQANDTIAKVKASGVITMGVRDSSGALSYTTGDGKYTGYHVEICQRIIANLEKAVGKKLEVKYQPVTSQNRIPLVQNGTVDIECGSTTNNATRQKDVSFLLTTYVEEVRIAVKANSGHRRRWPAEWPQRRHHRRAPRPCSCCASMSAPPASTSRKSSARTTPTASCCWNRAAPTLS